MAEEIINAGASANDGTGDKWRDAFLKVISNFSQLFVTTIQNTADITALQSQIVSSCQIGMQDYSDDVSGAAIAVIGGGGFVELPNDGAGAGTNKLFKVPSVGELWDTSTNSFKWNDGLSLGDQVNIRINIRITTTSANQTANVRMLVGIGGTPRSIYWDSKYYKTSGVQANIASTSLVYMGDSNTLDNGAKFEVESDHNCTVEVIGWAIQHFVRNVI